MENQNLEKAIIEDQNLGEVVLISVPVSENFLTLADGQYHTSSTPEEIESELSDDTLLKNLLQKFQMEPELIKIDFQTMYPGKDQLMFSKWKTFKTKIGLYCEKNIHNDFCKQLFCNAKSSTNQDAQDYIFTILLNTILPSSARFENNSGKRRKKVTIVDAQESFALRVQTINDYRRQIDIVIYKYYSAGLTVQPFLIVEGMSDVDIKGFYIHSF